MEPKVIFEDESLMVMDKPAGWIVNEAETTTNQVTVQEWVEKNIKSQISKRKDFRNGIVHRLDKETSGILLVAKTKEAFEELQRQFKSREVRKTYTALVHGKVEPKEGEIRTTVGRLPWHRDRFGVIPGGRESNTNYKVISYYLLPTTNFPHLKDYSLVEFYPKTGRTHQIRIHSKYIGHPIVSDDFYAGRKTVRADKKWCPRLFLHASGISFTHPKSNKKVDFESKLPKDLTESLSKLLK